MRPHHSQKRSGFSLLELVIVVVIIAVIAAIAIPRLSRGSKGAADSALAGNLSVLRNAIDLFATEHGCFPKVATFEAQMIQYTDTTGTSTKADPDATHYFGPYLRQIPPIPVGANKGSTLVSAAAGAGVAWVYDETKGTIKANAAGTDDSGKAYTDY